MLGNSHRRIFPVISGGLNLFSSILGPYLADLSNPFLKLQFSLERYFSFLPPTPQL